MTSRATDRRIFQVQLAPTVGTRIQPTGFPDLGPALYERPVVAGGEVQWQDALLVESAQSMANRLEAVGWDPVENRPVPELDGLPWVRVVHEDEGEYLTSSRTEAHRLASAFIKDAKLNGQAMRDVIRERLNLRADRPSSTRDIAQAVMKLDPLCLIHGVFFAESAKVWPGQPKIPRALTAFIEAYGVKPAHSGGVKRDHVRHQITDTGGSSEGYGTVPYHRTEWSAESIVAYVSLDRAQLMSYGLGDDAAGLLEAVALWEVRRLFGRPLRLRTACDLAVVGPLVDSDGVPLEEEEELAGRIRAKTAACAALLDGAGPIEVTWRPEKKGAKRGASPAEDEGEGE